MITTIGPHRVRHGDVMDTAGLASLMGDDRADIIYSDPPWGKGNLKFWATMNRKDTGAIVEPPDLDPFLDQIFGLARRYAKGIFLVEYGTRWDDDIIGRGTQFGFTHLGKAVVVYGKPPLPLHLHLFAKVAFPVPAGYFERLTNSTGFETVRLATEPFAKPGGLVLDMCCGLGYSARMALHWGMTFRGNELNAVRLQETMKKLTRGEEKKVQAAQWAEAAAAKAAAKAAKAQVVAEP